MQNITRFFLGFILFAFLYPIHHTVAQTPEEVKAPRLMAQARKLEQKGDLGNAIALYQQVADAYPNNLEANYKAGELALQYRLGYQQAHTYLERVYRADPAYHENLLYYLGKAKHLAEEVQVATTYLSIYLNKGERSSTALSYEQEAIKCITECEVAMQMMQAPQNYIITNLSQSINSEFPEYSPTLNAKGDLLIFTSRRPNADQTSIYEIDGLPYEDIFVAKLNSNNQWEIDPELSGGLNTPYHDSNLTLSPDGKTLYVYSDNNQGDIYRSVRRADGSWGTPEAVPGLNTPFTENGFAISTDGNLAIFSSDRPLNGQRFNYNLYSAERTPEGTWGRIKPLPLTINTPYQEEAPYLDPDGKTLYFSSDGLGSMGGHDIFKTTYDSTSKRWSPPVNLGYPLNNVGDNISFVVSSEGTQAYTATQHRNGLGASDIYVVERKSSTPWNETPGIIVNANTASNEYKTPTESIAPFLIELVITDEEGNAIPARVKFQTVNEGKYLEIRKLSKGNWRCKIPPSVPEGTPLIISITAKGYQPGSFEFNCPPRESELLTFTQEFQLMRIE